MMRETLIGNDTFDSTRTTRATDHRAVTLACCLPSCGGESSSLITSGACQQPTRGSTNLPSTATKVKGVPDGEGRWGGESHLASTPTLQRGGLIRRKMTAI